MQSILPLPLQISEDKDKGSEKGNNGNEADDVCVDNKRGPQEDRVGAEASSKFRHLIDELKWLFTTREGLIGEYEYAAVTSIRDHEQQGILTTNLVTFTSSLLIYPHGTENTNIKYSHSTGSMIESPFFLHLFLACNMRFR